MQKLLPIRPLYKIVYLLIVQLDTIILFFRALAYRASSLGIGKMGTMVRLPEDISILYFDLGTHKEGGEMSYVVDDVLPRVCTRFEAYGFEASQESFEDVSAKFSGRENIGIIHKALCYDLPREGKIKLYKDMEGGIGDSLYRQTASYEEVDAMRLSDFLREKGVFGQRMIILLRMNIEGAEYDVLRDLVDSGIAENIDGYFGMWDDLSKIDIQRDDEFRRFLSSNGIHTFPFNGRDLRWPLRKKCIAYQMRTDILRGLARLENGRWTRETA